MKDESLKLDFGYVGSKVISYLRKKYNFPMDLTFFSNVEDLEHIEGIVDLESFNVLLETPAYMHWNEEDRIIRINSSEIYDSKFLLESILHEFYHVFFKEDEEGPCQEYAMKYRDAIWNHLFCNEKDPIIGNYKGKPRKSKRRNKKFNLFF